MIEVFHCCGMHFVELSEFQQKWRLYVSCAKKMMGPKPNSKLIKKKGT